MARVKLQFPGKKAIFATDIPVRITDLNYGNHVGNDAVLSIAHEARVQMLQSFGYTELDIGGCGMIMADAAIVFKKEGFYGDRLRIEIFTGDTTSVSFELLYRISTQRNGTSILIAEVKTGMVCFDYAKRKVCETPVAFLEKLTSKM